MVIPHPVVRLDYNPVTDILLFQWPELTYYTESEADFVLKAVLDAIRSYDVRYLLVDTRKDSVKIDSSLYKEIKLKFFSGLNRTRLKKLARVVSAETGREDLIKEVIQQTHCTIPLLNFYNMEAAINWLTTKE